MLYKAFQSIFAIVIIFAVGCTLNEPQPTIGIAKCTLFVDQNLSKELDDLQMGTNLSIISENADSLEVSTSTRQKGWIYRYCLCSADEFERRKNSNEIPDRVITVMYNNNRFYLTGGEISISNDQPSAKPGQAFWMDPSTKGNLFLIGNTRLPRTAYYIYLIKEDGSIKKLPIFNYPSDTEIKEEKPDDKLYLSRERRSAPWRIYPSPSDLSLAIDVGKIKNLPSYIKNYERDKIDSWERIERIVSDPIFMISPRQEKFNLWALMEKIEMSAEIPHFLFLQDKSYKYIEDTYGKADSVGSFHYQYTDNDNQNKDGVKKVYWYGVIFFIVNENGRISSIGGWPSQI